MSHPPKNIGTEKVVMDDTGVFNPDPEPGDNPKAEAPFGKLPIGQEFVLDTDDVEVWKKKSASIAEVSRIRVIVPPESPKCPDCGSITVKNGDVFKCLNCGKDIGVDLAEGKSQQVAVAVAVGATTEKQQAEADADHDRQELEKDGGTGSAIDEHLDKNVEVDQTTKPTIPVRTVDPSKPKLPNIRGIKRHERKKVGNRVQWMIELESGRRIGGEYKDDREAHIELEKLARQ